MLLHRLSDTTLAELRLGLAEEHGAPSKRRRKQAYKTLAVIHREQRRRGSRTVTA